ncbi:hypothetical protein N0V88_003459 [Collariella sp. IMI 366227]|nr:hypothetical protein N0V88_003459 [Collariella sp. IMI 366227]
MARPPPGQFMPSQHSGAYMQNVYRPTQGAQGAQGQPQGQTWQLPSQNPAQRQAFTGSPGPGYQNAAVAGQQNPQTQYRAFSGATGNGQQTVNGSGPQGQGQGQQPTPGGSIPPHMLPVNLLQRFQPQGGSWTPQESHLAEPLQPTSRHRQSPSSASSQQQPFYGFDKETGVEITPSSPPQRQTSPQTQQTQQQTQQAQQNQQNQPAANQQPSGVPSQGDTPMSPQPNQAMQTNYQNLAAQRPEGEPLSKLQSHQSGQQRPGTESGHNKRNSGVFSSIRGRFGGHHSEEPKPQSTNGYAPSVASTTTGGTGQQEKPHPPFAPTAPAPPGDNVSFSQSRDSIVAQGPGTPLGGRMTPQPSPFAPPTQEKKITKFFGLSSHPPSLQPGAPGRPDLPRASTSHSTMSHSNMSHKQTPSIGGGPKNRFSALKDKFRSSPQDGPKNTGPSFGVRPQGQYQAYPPGQFQGQPQISSRDNLRANFRDNLKDNSKVSLRVSFRDSLKSSLRDCSLRGSSLEGRIKARTKPRLRAQLRRAALAHKGAR